MKQLMPQFMRDKSQKDGHAEPERSKGDTKQRRTTLRVKNKGEWRNVGTHGSCVRTVGAIQGFDYPAGVKHDNRQVLRRFGH